MRKGRGRVKARAQEKLNDYFTVLIPWSSKPTKWHPTEKTGPFAVLSRGAFKSNDAAIAWAVANLGGQPFTVRRVVAVHELFEGAKSDAGVPRRKR